MADPFLAEIRIFPFNFAPTGWLPCNGQILPISQYTALFSLIGTYYGGNGTSNFALPNFQGLMPLGQGQGTGLSPRVLGETGGVDTVALSLDQLPVHSHSPAAVSGSTDLASPGSNTWGEIKGRPAPNYYATNQGTLINMNSNAIGLSGGGQTHNNLMPYLALNFCIATQGIYPPKG